MLEKVRGKLRELATWPEEPRRNSRNISFNFCVHVCNTGAAAADARVQSDLESPSIDCRRNRTALRLRPAIGRTARTIGRASEPQTTQFSKSVPSFHRPILPMSVWGPRRGFIQARHTRGNGVDRLGRGASLKLPTRNQRGDSAAKRGKKGRDHQ